MFVSIIIPMRNEENFIDACLGLLLRQITSVPPAKIELLSRS